MTRFSLAFLGLVLATVAACGDEDLGQYPGTVFGQICNPVTGRPAAGAKVTATFTREGATKVESKSTETDDKGFYKLAGLPSGDVKIQGVTDEFRTKQIEKTIEARKEVQATDPACRDQPEIPGEGAIVGQVCNRHVGEFVKNGTVLLQLADGTSMTTTTDPEDGTFRLDGVPEGTYSVIVDGEGFRKSYSVTVKEGEATEIEEQVRDCTPPDPLTTGKIVGQVCASEVDGQSGGPLADARVFIVGGLDGEQYEDQTLADGTFTIAGIPTPQSGLQVRVEKGGFAYQWNDVDVFPISGANARPDGTDLTASVGCQTLVPDDGRRYLVVDGVFDDIYKVLDRMGLSQITERTDGVPPQIDHLWTADVFGDYERLSSYDAVFVNCGVSEVDFDLGMNASFKANLKRYVQEGGSLYVSDWAYDLVEAVYPEKINFLRDDTENDGAEHGVDGSYHADVLDEGLRQYLTDSLGSDDVTINYKFGNFVLISEVAPGVTTYLRGDMQYAVNGGAEVLPDAPITVGFTDGLGRVIYTTFHQETNSDGTDADELDGPEDYVLRYLVLGL